MLRSHLVAYSSREPWRQLSTWRSPGCQQRLLARPHLAVVLLMVIAPAGAGPREQSPTQLRVRVTPCSRGVAPCTTAGHTTTSPRSVTCSRGVRPSDVTVRPLAEAEHIGRRRPSPDTECIQASSSRLRPQKLPTPCRSPLRRLAHASTSLAPGHAPSRCSGCSATSTFALTRCPRHRARRCRLAGDAAIALDPRAARARGAPLGTGYGGPTVPPGSCQRRRLCDAGRPG